MTKLSIKDLKAKLSERGIEDIAEVYSGSSGCMCGCQGKYNDSDLAKKRMYNKFMKNLDVVEFTNGFDGEDIFTIETETRINAIYFKKNPNKCYLFQKES
jgi:hypothetical protein